MPTPNHLRNLELIPHTSDIEEHHIQNFDPSSFFTLHDYDNSGYWTGEEIRRTYGLDDESSKDVPANTKDTVVIEVMKTWDTDFDGRISRDEWMKGWIEQAKRLKDFGTGPGHHGDDEYEYEIHHFEKFHDESTSSIQSCCLPRRPQFDDAIAKGRRSKTPKKKTLPTPKTLRISGNTTSKPTRRSGKNSSTNCP